MPPRRPPQRHRPVTLATAAGVSSLILPGITLLRQYSINSSPYPILYTFAISFVTFLLYGYDKMQARNMRWRTKEVTLHFLAIVGGWPGALAGMHYFQHKTRKASFQLWFWAIVLAWEGVAWAQWTGGMKAH